MGKTSGKKKTAPPRPVPDEKDRVPAELLKQCVMAASCGLVVTDCQQKGNPIVFVNQAFEEITGYMSREVLGTNGRFLLGKDGKQEPLEQIREAVRSGRRCVAVLRNYRKDGSLFYNELSISPVGNGSGKPTHFTWLQKDVTALVEAEERVAALIAEKEGRFAAYMENAHEAIWRIDFDPPISLDAPESRQIQEVFDNGVFTEANDAVARIYGYSRGKEVIGRPLKEFIEQYNPKNIERIAELVRELFLVKDLVTYEKISDGTTATILNNITPDVREGRIRYIWGTSRDISKLFEVQEDLKESKTKLVAQKKVLKEKNIALKELITQIELEREMLKDQVMANVEHFIMPSLERIRLNNGANMHIEEHRKALENLTSSFGRKLVDSSAKLTPREIEVCDMVKNGLNNKEIARLLDIALHTVEKHRRMARNKLGLANKGINLRTHLNSL